MALLNIVGKNLTAFSLLIFFLEILVFIGLVYCLVKVASIKKKSEIFFAGKDGKNLEELLLKNIEKINFMDSEIQELYNISNEVHKLSLKSIHKVGIIRFNPFNDIGGDQSFSVALLDGKNTGVVISSLHTKEGTRVYSKPINKGEANKYPLTEEEKQAIKLAMKNSPNKV